MRAALCIGGEAPQPETIARLLGGVDVVAAADSGFDYLYELGIEPDLLVGDMDSTRDGNVIGELGTKVEVELTSAEKDETDTEIGLRRLRERGAEHIILIGGGGGRLDHLLGLVILFDRELRPDRWYTGKDLVISIDGPREFSGLEGSTVSLFPAGKGRCRLKSRGLKWPLDELVWERGDAGISNLVVSETCAVEPVEGRAILVCSSEVCTAAEE
jgi:thiamine pyrophosphokinase